MRVGAYLGDFAPEEGGAHGFVATVLDALLAAAPSSGHQFVALCEPGQSVRQMEHRELPRRTRLSMGFEVLRHYAPLAHLLRPGRVERAARSLGLDLVWFLPGIAYEAIDTPYIGTIWDLQHRLHPWFPEVGADGYWEHRELMYARFVRRAAHLLTGTEVGAGQLHQFYGVPRERISVLPQPVPRLASEATPPAGIAPGERFLYYPAQFWPHKNHVNLLHALKQVEGVSLALSGSDKGNLEHVRRTTASLGLESRVRFLGFVSPGEVAWLYRNALAMVYPSFNGPDNLPPLEAFAAGCPVAMADYPGAQEQAGDAALRFDPRDPGAMAGALLRLRDDAALRENLARLGRERAAARTGAAYVAGVIGVIDAFAPLRRCWS